MVSETTTEEVTVAIVFHSGYGHTARQAEAVSLGVMEGAMPLLLSVEQARKNWAALERADAIIFGAPTYMGSAVAHSNRLWTPVRARFSKARGRTSLLQVSRIRRRGPATSSPR